MKTMPTGSALALLAAVAQPASAQDDDLIEVNAELLTPSAGVMNDHVHESGEAMIGLRFERQRFSGPTQAGTGEISDAAILAAGYTIRVRSMEMDMVMLDLMFAPTSDLTLMVMPHYMWHRMEMVGIDPANTGGAPGGSGGHSGHGHGGLPFGEIHEHGTAGFGDTLVSASYRLLRSPGMNAHATLGVWVPTGEVDRTNPDGTFVHYGMQPGSGTWDIEPTLTVTGGAGGLGWGGQAAYRWRTKNANESGFAFGDRARATGWASYLLTARLGATLRVEYQHDGAIEGHYNAAHNHSAPPDRQANYGGEVLSAAFGLNWALPVSRVHDPQLGVEFGLPLHQDLNGIQLPRDWRVSLEVAQTF